MRFNRKEFIRLAGATGAGLALGPLASASPQKAAPAKLKLGLASYTLRSFKLDQVIAMTKRVGLSSIALKSMHMPLEAPAEEIKAMAAKVRESGLQLYGAGVIYMKSETEVTQAFAYAAAAGLEMIIGVPNHELLSLATEQVKKYNIKLAIHNHGPGDKLYSSPNDVWEKIKDLDPRVGLCIDIGHVVRIGEDPIPQIKKYKDRLYDMHLKDVDKAANDGVPVEIGRGVIDIPGVMKTLRAIKYQGYVAFEYEKDGEDPLAGLAESIGYINGVNRMV